MKLIYAAMAVLVFAAGACAEGYWEYGSWRVTTVEHDTQEDLLRFCIASTGGDGEPSVFVEFMDHDAGPPDAYPSVVFTETAPRGFQTQMQDSMTGYVIFDSYERADAAPFTYVDEDGFAMARVRFDDSQWMLQRMQANGRMDLVVAGRPVMAAQLNGFTAAYLKAADECGFTGVGVVE
ncbi:hypothetical protein [Celeribacter marinus]|uniref:hypothetical protein n=1 Tax=Celeribacter marinus TaxID=1397108 RepID=UPI003181D6FD